EDAFQATFLVLARKAGAIASRHLLANWLYGVAYNTSLKAKATIGKRQARETSMAHTAEPAAASTTTDMEMHALLDQELSRLPDKYRIPILLCDLEGKSHKEASQQLGWPQGTVSGRLARA